MRLRIRVNRPARVAVIGVVTLAISCLHYLTPPKTWPVQSIYMDLYYIPVLMGGLAFGLSGAMITYACVAVLYFPYIFVVWHIRGLLLAEDLLHTMFFGIFAFLTGFLVDREKKYRRQAERDAALAALGRAAGTVAHELRSPLTVIAGFARHIEKKKENSGKAIGVIIDATRTMQRIVDSTLDFARQLEPAFNEGDIVEVVERALEVCSAKAENHGVTLSREYTARPVRLVLDSFLCERALVNLLDNAIEASERGRTVTVRVVQEKECVMVTVQDNGAGMDKQVMENIFTPFYTTKTTGTGIGMALTRRIIESHGGSISVSSKPGGGTEVSIRLPYGR